MKATELQIGDWVCYDGDTEYTTPVKVDGLTTDDISLDGEGFLGGIEEIVIPIPLTPEILEKNGFEMFKYDGWVHFYQIYGLSALPFVIHSMIGGEMLSNEIDLFSTSTEDNCGITMQYVHELQHALRLCGLNNLADNFVI